MPSFSDETVSLGKEEAAALTRHAYLTMQGREAPSDADAGDRVTPVSSPLSGEPFDTAYVDAAMDAFDSRIASQPPGPRAALRPLGGASGARDSGKDEAPRLFPGAPGPAPAQEALSPSTSQAEEDHDGGRGQPGSAGGAEVSGDKAAHDVAGGPFNTSPQAAGDEEATRMFQSGVTSQGDDEATRMFQQNPETGGPRPLTAPGDEDATRIFGAEHPGGPEPTGSSSLAHTEAPQREVDGNRSARRVQRKTDPFVLPPELEPTKGSWGLYLFVVSTSLLLGVTGLFAFRRDVFELGVEKMRATLGVASTPPPSTGPPFDTQAAGDELARVAERAAQCAEPGGPTGAGRVRVLFQPTGDATSAAVSSPFHQTSVGQCLVTLFKTSKVPAFGGQAVIVTKTFRLD